jgi:hypothetical protein
MNGAEQKHTENFITKTISQYIEDREKDWREKYEIQKVWNWCFAFVCLCCFCMCAYGVNTFISWNRTWNYYIEHELVISELREQRELVESINNQKKAARDSAMADAYVKKMKEYDSVPYYKGN